MANLSQNLQTVLLSNGISQLTIDILKLSPTAVDKLNRFAIDSGVESAPNGGIGSSLGIVLGNEGTSLGRDRTGRPFINFDQRQLPGASGSPEYAFRSADNALKLIHEVDHSAQVSTRFENYLNPIAYANASARNEGDSLYAEWQVRIEILSSPGFSNLKRTYGLPELEIPQISLFSQPFRDQDPNTGASATRDFLVADASAFYAGLAPGDLSPAEKFDAMVTYLGQQNDKYSRPSTDQNVTYRESSIRAYVLAYLFRETSDSSGQYGVGQGAIPEDAIKLTSSGGLTLLWQNTVRSYPGELLFSYEIKADGTKIRLSSRDGTPGTWFYSEIRDNFDGRTQRYTVYNSPVANIGVVGMRAEFSTPDPLTATVFEVTNRPDGTAVLSGVISINGQSINSLPLNRAIGDLNISLNSGANIGLSVSQNSATSWTIRVPNGADPLAASRIAVLVNPDGSFSANQAKADGSEQITGYTSSGAVVALIARSTQGDVTTSKISSPDGALLRTETTRNLYDGDSTAQNLQGSRTVIDYPAGGSTDIIRDKNGTITSQVTTAAPLQTIGQLVSDVSDVVSAIRSGSTLAQATSGLRLINNVVNPNPGAGSAPNVPALNAFSAVAGGISALVQLDKKIVGGLIAVIEQHIFSDAFTASIMHIDVLPQARMGGYGVRLLKAFEGWAKNRNVAELYFGVNSQTGVAQIETLALRMGYEKVGGNYAKRN
jgi:GNAT superfamily N-acetyltransferase/surface antigen